jgi:signal transduction histidine kinase
VKSFAPPRLVRSLVVFGGLTLIVLAAYAAAWCVNLASRGAAARSTTWMAATLIVAVAVPLVRPRLDRLADRLAETLGGDRFTVVSNFVERVADTLAVDDVLPQMAKTATYALRSTRGEVCLWLADGGEWRQTWPPGEAHVPDALSISLSHAGTSVGWLAVDTDVSQIGQVERDLLDRLAGPAGVALSNVRLTFELRHRLDQMVEIADQVRLSRERLLEAAAVQRRRFAKEVEDRVLRPLDAADAALQACATGATGALMSARASADEALAALRQLAAGVFPAALVDSGLVAALTLHLQANFSKARLQADTAASDRHQLSIEAAVYFCAVALLSDADPDEQCRVELTVSRGGDRLELGVLAQPSPSSDTAALVRDRAEAAGGTADLDQSPMFVAVPIALALATQDKREAGL